MYANTPHIVGGSAFTITTPLAPGVYEWQMIPKNATGSATGCAVRTFTVPPPQPPPANDECQNAILMTMANFNDLSNVTIPVNLSGATMSLPPLPTCFSQYTSYYPYSGDVWCKFVATSTECLIKLDEERAQLFESADGTCNTLTSKNCAKIWGNSNEGPNIFYGLPRLHHLNTLIIGKTYYLRLASENSYFARPPINIAVTKRRITDICNTAIPLTLDVNGDFDTVTSYADFEYVNLGGNQLCDQNSFARWYSFTPTVSGKYELRFIDTLIANSTYNPAATTTVSLNTRYRIWENACTAIGSDDDCQFGGMAVTTAMPPNFKDTVHNYTRMLTAGRTYYIENLINLSNSVSSYNIHMQAKLGIRRLHSPNTNLICNDAATLTVAPDRSSIVYTRINEPALGTQSPLTGLYSGARDPFNHLWYKFVPSASRAKVIFKKTTGVTNYVGRYLTFNSDDCAVNSAIYTSPSVYNFPNNSQTQEILYGSLVPGRTYYLFFDIPDNQNFVADVAIFDSIAAPLNTKLGELYGVRNGNNAILEWRTTAEDAQSSYMLVERSSDGSSFSEIARISATQKPNGATYNHTDVDAGAGKIYYRIKSYDADGSFLYSNTVLLKGKGDGMDIQVFPNPVTADATLTISGYTPSGASVTLTDAKGAVLFTTLVSKNIVTIPMQQLPRGIYFIRYQDAGANKVIKLVK